MKNKILTIAMSAIMFTLASCNSNEEPAISQSLQNVEVVRLSDYLPSSTRSGESDKVLRFKDQAAFDSTVESLKGMSEDEKMDYFNSLGFDGAYVTLTKAHNEADQVLDRIESMDSIANDFVKKNM